MGEVVESSVLSVCFFGTDRFVFDLDVALYIQNSQARSVTRAILGNVGQVQHAKIAGRAVFDRCAH